jgi:tetratricopeptide (TPR) repeat protein
MASSQTPKQIDIGAEAAPLSDQQRADLAAAVERHEYAAERSVIDHARAEHPDSWELGIMEGRLAFFEKHPSDAADAFLRAAKIKALSEDDRIALAASLQAAGRGREAREAMISLVVDYPSQSDYPYLLGRFDADNKRLEDAVADFEQALKLDPDNLRALQELGKVQEALGHGDAARSTYAAAVEKNRAAGNRSEIPPVLLGALLVKSGQLDIAEKLFREALNYSPASAQAHFYIGQIAEKRDQHEAAIAEYQAAVMNASTFLPAWQSLAREYTFTGQKEQADRCLSIARQLEERQKLPR